MPRLKLLSVLLSYLAATPVFADPPTQVQLSEFKQLVMVGRITAADLEAFLTDKGAPEVQTSAVSGHDSAVAAGDKCVVMVDYDLSLAEAFMEARVINSNSFVITQKNFPSSRKGKVIVEINLVKMGRDAKTAEVNAELERLGLRAATLRETLAWAGQIDPWYKLKFWSYIALGSAFRDSYGDVYIPHFGGFNGEREVAPAHLEGNIKWRSDQIFLAVRK